MALHRAPSLSTWPACATLLLWLLAACGHGDPFRYDSPGIDSIPTTPMDGRLTLATGTDLTPAWVADGSGLLYSYERIGQGPIDRCLALLPPHGGTRRELPCSRSLGARDTVEALYEASPGPGGRVLFVREISLPGDLTPLFATLEVAPLLRPDQSTVLLNYPYTASSGKIHDGITHLRWLDASHAVYVANRVTYPRDCGSCPPDTVKTGIELVGLDLSGPSPMIQPIPNTDGASSVDVAGPEDLYFTRIGDSLVYHLSLTTGIIDTTWDFGPEGIARDVAVSADGTTLGAIVGEGVSFIPDPNLGDSQEDNGGHLWTVDLGGGTATRHFIDSYWLRRPRFAPSGGAIIAESRHLTYASCGPGCLISIPSKSSDIWLLEQP